MTIRFCQVFGCLRWGRVEADVIYGALYTPLRLCRRHAQRAAGEPVTEEGEAHGE